MPPVKEENLCTPPRDICLEKFGTILEKLDDLAQSHESFKSDLTKRLFIDNGTTSLQSKTNDNSRSIKALIWVFGIYNIMVLALLGWLFAKN